MMTSPKPMRDFSLEVFFSKWEFKAKHHMTASDLETLTLSQLLAMASEEDREKYDNLTLGYTETWGAPELRELIAGTYQTMQKDNILCLAGAGEGIYALARCLLTEKDHVIVPTPNYQSAETIPLAICEVTGVPLIEDNTGQSKGGWKLDIAGIKAAIRPNTKLLSINFPHNPTGYVLSAKELEDVITLCRENNIYLFSDEVYRGVELNSEDQMPQIADVYEKGISLNVMSKAYGLPGLRIGWIASQDKEVLLKVERYKHFLSICNSAPSEQLAIIALKNKDAILARNLNLMQRNVAELEQLFADYPGIIDWQRPLGGCVAFPRYIGPGNVEDFCKSLLEESGILLLPASIYASDLNEVSKDRFRLGFGRDKVFTEGLKAMRQHFEANFSNL